MDFEKSIIGSFVREPNPAGGDLAFLRATRDLIERGWTQYTFHNYAVRQHCYCLLGAARMVTYPRGYEDMKSELEEDYLEGEGIYDIFDPEVGSLSSDGRLSRLLGFEVSDDVAWFNDHAETTQEFVLRRLDEAVARLER